MKDIKRVIKSVYELNCSDLEACEKGKLVSTTTTDYNRGGERVKEDYSELCGIGYETDYENDRPIRTWGDLSSDFVYDDEGRLVSITTDTGAGFVVIVRNQYNEDGSWTEYEYHDSGIGESEVSRKLFDKDGNLVYERCYINEFTDEGPNCLDYEYDSDHRLISKEGILDGEFYVAKYRYNEQGQRSQMLTAVNDWSLYEGDEDTDEDTEPDEVPMHFEEVEYQYHADGTWAKITTYHCQAPSLGEFFGGNYVRELHGSRENIVEEATQGDNLVRTTKVYVDGALRFTSSSTYKLPDNQLLTSTVLSAEDETLVETEVEYWD